MNDTEKMIKTERRSCCQAPQGTCKEADSIPLRRIQPIRDGGDGAIKAGARGQRVTDGRETPPLVPLQQRLSMIGLDV